MMQLKQIARLLVRILIGVMFITTAILKLYSIDQFEIYIYSFNIFNFIYCSIVARLLICVEFMIGGFLIFNIQYRKTWWFTMAVMIGFTLFLIYVAVFREDTNCHCFGELIELNPIHSILKNLLTILLLLFIFRTKEKNFKGKKVVAWLIPSLAFIFSFIIITPDALYNLFRSKHHNFNDVYFYEIQKDTTLHTQLIPEVIVCENTDSIVIHKEKKEFQLDTGSYVIGFMASGCPYCRLSVKKIDAFFKAHQLPEERCIIFMWGGDKAFLYFWKETQVYHYQYRNINPYIAIDLTFGVFPLYILVKNKKVINVFDFRELSEKEVVNFFK